MPSWICRQRSPKPFGSSAVRILVVQFLLSPFTFDCTPKCSTLLDWEFCGVIRVAGLAEPACLATPLHTPLLDSSLQWRSWTRRLLAPAAAPMGPTQIQLILSPLLMNLSEQCALCLGSVVCSWSLFRPSHQQIWREDGEWAADAVFAIWVVPQSFCSGRGLGRRNTCLASHILTHTVAPWILLGASEHYLPQLHPPKDARSSQKPLMSRWMGSPKQLGNSLSCHGPYSNRETLVEDSVGTLRELTNTADQKGQSSSLLLSSVHR